MKAVILAAGEGTRLYPITKTRPKPNIPIGGEPLLHRTLRVLKRYGNIEEVILIVGHAKELIQKELEYASLPMKIIYAIQEERKGTAHALNLAKKFLQDEDYFLFLYGDIFIKDTDFKALFEKIQSLSNEEQLLCAKKVAHPERYGVLVTNTQNHLLEILEKPQNPPSNLISAGIMYLSTRLFSYMNIIKPSTRGEYELPDLIKADLQKGNKFAVWELQGPWIDIGYPWDVLRANKEAMEEITTNIEGEVQPNVHIEGQVIVKKGAVIRSGAYIIGPVIIDENTVIGPNCFIRPATYIGKNCRIGNAVEIKNSIILDKTNIGHLSYVGDSIIGSHCNFGAGTKVANLRLDSKQVKMWIKGKKVVTPERKLGIFMGDNVKTGINASLMPGVKIGPNTFIGAHTLIAKDVEENSLVYYDPFDGKLIIKKRDE